MAQYGKMMMKTSVFFLDNFQTQIGYQSPKSHSPTGPAHFRPERKSAKMCIAGWQFEESCLISYWFILPPDFFETLGVQSWAVFDRILAIALAIHPHFSWLTHVKPSFLIVKCPFL